MDSDTYLTIVSFSQGLYKEKGSRFISLAFPVKNQEEIKSTLSAIKKEHHSARHHCYAWMLGNERQMFRANDDGEPAGTAGRQILGLINSYGLTNILVIVVRYFGGKLLGASGLIHAYRTAADTAIKNSEIKEQVIREFYELKFPYSSVNPVIRIIKDEGINQDQVKFGNECSMLVNIKRSSSDRVLKAFERIDGLKFNFKGTF